MIETINKIVRTQRQIMSELEGTNARGTGKKISNAT